ncbi:MAG: ABC transporter permease [Peptococcaceae bacterium]|nr:ABC transporter permease [Peptococcaceae bacterium]
MIAVLKHELRSYFHSFTAYVFGAFFLVIIGIGALLYNLQAAVSNFEYVLSFASIIYVVIVPLLTMRVIAEERKQRTDQLMYALPLSTMQVVLGKYLALLALYLVPILIICAYPLIFSFFGEVYLPVSYGTIVAAFLMGAALLAVGMFLSSLTENQGLAAGLGVAVILFNYYSVSLAEYFSATARGSLIVILLCVIAIALLTRALTQNQTFATMVWAVLCFIICVLYLTDASRFENLVPNVMKRLSLFEQLNVFASGVFDLTAVVYFLSVAGFFVFLTVQSLEKRRYL